MTPYCDHGDPLRRACIDALLGNRAMPIRRGITVQISSQLNGDATRRTPLRTHGGMDADDGTGNLGSWMPARRAGVLR